MNKNDRVGETKIMNCGMNATIIEYINSNNITIQFEDDTVVKNKTYQNFRKGLISNPNLLKNYSKYIGETRIMNCGMNATIIEYRKYKDIDIQFEDGIIVKNKAYDSFKNGNINNPNFNKHIGETKLMNCGMKCTIIDYINSKNITVQFENKTIIKNKSYSNFKKSSIANLNLLKYNLKHINETKMMNCGMKATIIEYINANNITVQFEDGAVVKNKTYSNFKKGGISNFNTCIYTYKEFTGTLKEITNYFNLNHKNIRIKINKCNMTVEEAIITPLVRFKQNNFTYKGENGTMRELCQKFDKNFIEVYNKVKYNHTFKWSMDSTKNPYDWENDYYNYFINS